MDKKSMSFLKYYFYVKLGENVGLIILFNNVLLVIDDHPKRSFRGIIWLKPNARTHSTETREGNLKQLTQLFQENFLWRKRQ